MTTTTTTPKPQGGFLSRQLQQLAALASLVALIILFGILSPNFLTAENLLGTVLPQTAVVGILAVGTTFVIITGGIDLSLGFGMALTGVVAGLLMVNLGLPVIVGVLGALATGALMGFINGFNVAVLRFPPFIATLAMMMIAQGLALVLSNVQPIYLPDEARLIANGLVVPGSPLPTSVVIFFALAIVAWIILSKTVLGRYTFAIGSNEEATRLSGINTRKWTIAVYVLAGVFTGIAGIIMASRLGSAQPGQGAGMELQAIAAVIIGGTSLMGGRGSIAGTVIGALIMSVLTNGLRILSVRAEWQTVIIGLVVLLAVYADMARRKRSI